MFSDPSYSSEHLITIGVHVYTNSNETDKLACRHTKRLGVGAYYNEKDLPDKLSKNE